MRVLLAEHEKPYDKSEPPLKLNEGFKPESRGLTDHCCIATALDGSGIELASRAAALDQIRPCRALDST